MGDASDKAGRILGGAEQYVGDTSAARAAEAAAANLRAYADAILEADIASRTNADVGGGSTSGATVDKNDALVLFTRQIDALERLIEKLDDYAFSFPLNLSALTACHSEIISLLPALPDLEARVEGRGDAYDVVRRLRELLGIRLPRVTNKIIDILRQTRENSSDTVRETDAPEATVEPRDTIDNAEPLAEDAEMNTPTRDEIDLKIENMQLRMDGRLISIEGKMDALATQVAGSERAITLLAERAVAAAESASNLKQTLWVTSITTVLAVLGIALAAYFGTQASNIGIVGSTISAFEAGRAAGPRAEQTPPAPTPASSK